MTAAARARTAAAAKEDAPRAADELVRLDQAAVRRAGATVWSDVDLHVRAGEFIAVLGPNGSGKSTLLGVLLGLLALSDGRGEVMGREPGAHNARIGYLPQRRSFDAASRIRGVDVVRLGVDGARWGLPLPAWLPGARRSRALVSKVMDLRSPSTSLRKAVGGSMLVIASA